MDDTTKDQAEDKDGQVSELAPQGAGPEEISAGDSVAGQPDQESGDVQEGSQGPNAIPEDPTGEHPHKP
jgi:hypothetical protein